MLTIRQAVEAGLWVPSHYGNCYAVVRLLPDGVTTRQEEIKERFRFLADARKQCDELNRQPILWDAPWTSDGDGVKPSGPE